MTAPIHRRQFLNQMSLAATSLAISATPRPASGAPLQRRSGANPFKIGILMHEREERPIDQTDRGFELIEIPVKILVRPLEPEIKWDETWALLKSWNLPPIRTASHFLEGVLPVVGPKVDFELAEVWVERALRRIAAIGVRVAGVYGGFFRPPDGFSRTVATDQSIRLCHMMADHAQRHGVTIALEPMADTTTLFPKYLDGVEFARRVARPEIRVMVDTLYFERLNQPLDDILEAPEYLAHVHTCGDRGQPGVGDRLEYHTRLFRILRDIGYEGGVMAASPWVSTTGGPMDYRVETGKALKYMKELRDKVYSK